MLWLHKFFEVFFIPAYGQAKSAQQLILKVLPFHPLNFPYTELVFQIVVKSSLRLAVVRLSFELHILSYLYQTKSLSSLVLMNTDIWKISKNYT